MTDRIAAAEKRPASTKPGLTPEQVAGMSADEKAQMIAELEAAIVELRRPVPEPYPKWVEIDGVPMIVQSPEEEAQKTKAAAENQGRRERAAAKET